MYNMEIISKNYVGAEGYDPSFIGLVNRYSDPFELCPHIYFTKDIASVVLETSLYKTFTQYECWTHVLESR